MKKSLNEIKTGSLSRTVLLTTNYSKNKKKLKVHFSSFNQEEFCALNRYDFILYILLQQTNLKINSIHSTLRFISRFI